MTAAIAAAVGAVLSFVGLLHAEQVGWAAPPQVALGYALLAVVLVGIRRYPVAGLCALAAVSPAEQART